MSTSAARTPAYSRPKTRPVALSIALLILAACSQVSMRVENPRMLPALSGSSAAVYFTMSNLTFADDTLLGASSDAAASIEIHRSALIKPDDREAIEAGGTYDYGAGEEEKEDKSELAAKEVAMDMAVLTSLQIKSGREIEFEPGYLHLMLIDLKQDFVLDDHFTLILHFEKAGDVIVDVQVVDDLN